MNKQVVKKISLAGMLIALGVICSAFYIPIGASKCFPVQHMINVIAGVILGPFYGVSMAFVTSLIRVLLGTGTLLAFPGSMIGAFFSGLLFRYTKRFVFAYAGEIIGTGILGALVSYPIATLILGKEAAVFAFVIPFITSSFGGATISVIFLEFLRKTNLLKQIHSQLEL